MQPSTRHKTLNVCQLFIKKKTKKNHKRKLMNWKELNTSI